MDEAGGVGQETFVVFDQTAAFGQPGEAAFDDTAAGLDGEPGGGSGAADDLQMELPRQQRTREN